MAYVYAYAPCSGTTGPQTHYCDGDPHVNVSCIGGYSPLDIMTYSQVDVYLHVTSLAMRARIYHCSGVCKDTSLTPWTYGLKVDLYLDWSATQYLGTLGYGHVDNRIAPGLYDSRVPIKLGRLPSDCDCGCSDGIHVHMQGNGTARSFGNCTGTSVSKGSTWIYRWLANV